MYVNMYEILKIYMFLTYFHIIPQETCIDSLLPKYLQIFATLSKFYTVLLKALIIIPYMQCSHLYFLLVFGKDVETCSNMHVVCNKVTLYE